MKIKFLMITAGICSSVFLSGCGKIAKACDDSDAIELVMQIAEPYVKNGLLILVTRNGYPNVLSNYENVVKHINEGNESLQAYIPAIEEVDKQFNKITLENIRTESMDDKLLKTECAADIPYDNVNVPIKYKLSVTSDGKLYGEVFGLN